MVLPHDQVISPADPPALRLQSYDSAFGAMFRLKRPRSLSFEELLVHPIPRARRGASVDSAIKESVDALGRMLGTPPRSLSVCRTRVHACYIDGRPATQASSE